MRDRFKQWFHDLTDKSGKHQDQPEEPTGTVTPESVGMTVEQLPQPERPPPPEEPQHREPAGSLAPGVPTPSALPPAPEPHTQRPGTTSPTAVRENSVSNTQVASAQSGLAAQHRTDTTFDDFLTQITNIAIHAMKDQEQQHELSDSVGRVADALREMAGDLVDDHNIVTIVAKQIADLADAAGEMKAQAQRSSEACGQAAEAGRVTAKIVARVYSEDMDAKHEAGLQHASAAAHHA
ncbi:hypothetical protein ACFZBU_39740 [Embleya sp. NPDC008237]|uniref:hypothetical protein n=1 Tax=Embleya sp. NPDC008237 TaxID=3363978 RepID=UPI0036E57FAD